MSLLMLIESRSDSFFSQLQNLQVDHLTPGCDPNLDPNPNQGHRHGRKESAVSWENSQVDNRKAWGDDVGAQVASIAWDPLPNVP